MKTSKKKKSPNYFGYRGTHENELILFQISRLLMPALPDSPRILLEEMEASNTLTLKKVRDTVLGLDINYESYTLLEACTLRQLLALFSKNVSYSDVSDEDRTKQAWDEFQVAEYRNHLTNERLLSCYHDASTSLKQGCVPAEYNFTAPFSPVHSRIEFKSSGKLSDEALQVLHLAALKIQMILGVCPSVEELGFKYGPGSCSTVDVVGQKNVRIKLNARLVCSKEMKPILTSVLNTLPHLTLYHFGKVYIGAARLSFVPKNPKTKRSVLVEPILNTPEQIGVGLDIKHRLMKAGLDLFKGQANNRQWAKEGSMGHNVCTLDFEQASNSISFMLVKCLLPDDWFYLLSHLRTGSYSYKKGKVVHAELEMFSSMGNGFTFELESLIFWAIGLACTEIDAQSESGRNLLSPLNGRVVVYGDDLICASEIVPLLERVCPQLGLRINTSKSYVRGPFRESCGHDYLNGTNIRPFYFKDKITSARLVGFLNHCNNATVNVLTADLTAFLIEQIPPRDRNFGPFGQGDGHIAYCDYDYLPLPIVDHTKHPIEISREVWIMRDCAKCGKNHAFSYWVKTNVVPDAGVVGAWQRDCHYYYTLKKRSISNDAELPSDHLYPLYMAQFLNSVFDDGFEYDPFSMGACEKVTRTKITESPRDKTSGSRTICTVLEDVVPMHGKQLERHLALSRLATSLKLYAAILFRRTWDLPSSVI